jgi:hypothetical protein
MSKLYATIESDSRSKPVTTRGHKMLNAHIRGWDIGVAVSMVCNNGSIYITVTKTGGSNRPSNVETLLSEVFDG